MKMDVWRGIAILWEGMSWPSGLNSAHHFFWGGGGGGESEGKEI